MSRPPIRPWLLVAGLALGCSALAQPFPFELEADRVPAIKTGGTCLIRGAKVLTAVRGSLENTDILVVNGKIAALGRGLKAPDGAVVIDGAGKVAAPGLVDGHSHRSSDGTNEGVESITGEVRIQDVLNPSAFNVWQALASGHTSALILHGSANTIGGQSVVVKYKYRRPASEAVVPDAPRQIKFALGENVTRKTSTTTPSRYPRSRMGVEAVLRRGFAEGREYIAAWEAFEAKKGPRPRKDIRLEALAGILKGKIWVQCHSYRSDEMLMLVRLSQEFGFKIGSMQHALEAYKIAPEMAKAGVGASIFVDNWSFKQEGYDAIPWNAALCTRAGVAVSINTDGVSGTSALNIDAAKTMRFGGLTEQEALQTVTIIPARQLGIDHRTGSIEVGKDADIALWQGHPLSVYSKCAMTIIEGEVFFQRKDAFKVDGAAPAKMSLDRQLNVSEAKLPPPSSSYAIVGARIFPVSGPEIPQGTLVVSNGRITAVGAKVEIPRGTRVIQGRGLRVYPGFIDGYSTMGLGEIPPIPVMQDSAELGTNNPELDALTALWVESAHYGPARYNGITNAFISPSGGAISGQAALINTWGFTTEDFGVMRQQALMVNFPAVARRGDLECEKCHDLLDASRLLGLGGADGHDHDHGGQAHAHTEPPTAGDQHLSLADRERFYDLLGGLQEAQPTEAVSESEGLGAYFDSALAYLAKRKENPAMPVNLGYEAMRPYLEGKKLVIINARTASAIRAAVAFARKYKLKAALRGASEAWKEARLLKASGIPVILVPAGRSTLTANTPDMPFDPYDTPYASAGWLARAGVKFCFGSGGPAEVMNLGTRVGQHCAYGLSQEDAVKALTLWAAEILGASSELGSLEPGKRGNFMVTDGDPFELTTTMRYVFVEGQPRPMVSKHTMLRDKYSRR